MTIGLLPPVVAELLMDARQASAEVDKFGAKMSTMAASTTGLMDKLGKATLLGAAGVAVASVKMASDFQTQMTRLYTAAGAPKDAVKAATDQVLQMGDAVGFSGTQMAEALYHPVSAGLDLQTSLQAVKFAAEEAQISGASLDDTTYSLSSVMKAFNIDASGAHDTMALLNSIVGQGDMRFQDFNVSVKNWAPTAAQMGISIQSMGAALAYLTDRGNSAEEASTRVTMGLTMMAYPSQKAAGILEGLGVASTDVAGSTDAMTAVMRKAGITQNQLAEDLKAPDGIYVALTHVKQALHDAGVEGTQADAMLSKVFGGGRSDKAILSLLQNLDGLKTKFDDIGTGVANFDQAWADTQQTFAFRMRQLGAEVENAAIKIGMILIPAVEAAVGWFGRHQLAVEAVAVAIGGLLTVSLIRLAQTLTTTVLTAIGKGVLGLESFLMGLKATTVATEAEAVASEGLAASLGGAIPVVGAVVVGIGLLASKMDDWLGTSATAGASVDQITKALAENSVAAVDATAGTQNIIDATDALGAHLAPGTDAVAAYGIALAKSGQKIDDAAEVTKNYDAALAQLVSSGHAAQAERYMAQITAATDAQGKALINTAGDFPQYFAALARAGAQSALAATSADGATQAVDANTVAMDENAKMAQQGADADTALSNSIDAVSASFSSMTGLITASGALHTFQKDLLSVDDTIRQNGKTFDDSSLSGLANEEQFRNSAKAILDYRDAQMKNGVSTDAANKTAADQATQLLAVWEQVTGNKKAVDDYATSIGLVPKDLTTTVSTPGMDAALEKAQRLAKLSSAGDNSSDYTPSPRAGHARGFAAGGRIVGGGTSTSDSIPIMASNDEWIVSAAAAASAGIPAMTALAAGNVDLAASLMGGGAAPVMPPAPGGDGVLYLTVPVYLDGKQVSGENRTQTLRYNRRNSKNGLTLTGVGG